jgi:hypothetical protein
MNLSLTSRRDRKSETKLAKRVHYRRARQKSRDYYVRHTKQVTVWAWRRTTVRLKKEPKIQKRLDKKIDIVWQFVSQRVLKRKLRQWVSTYTRHMGQRNMATAYLFQWTNPECAGAWRKWVFVIREWKYQAGWIRWMFNSMCDQQLRRAWRKWYGDMMIYNAQASS